MLSLALLGSGVSAQEQKRPVGNIASQPLWGPTGFNTVAYYFIPEIQAYYSVDDKKFIYMEEGKWAFSENLPAAFKDYDLYSAYKVVINRPQPYLNFRAHVARYGHYAGQKNRQVAIAQSSNAKYFVINGHPKASEEQVSVNKE